MIMQTKVTPESIRDACESAIGDTSISANFTVKYKKVCAIRRNGDDVQYTALCDPFEVLGRTYDEAGENAARIVRFFADRAKPELVEVTVPNSDLIADPKKVVAMLASKGLWVAAKRESILQIGELLSLIHPKNDIVTVSRPGWYGNVFASPTGEVFGEADTHYRLSEVVQFQDPEQKGSMDGWRDATRTALESANGDFLCIGLLSGFAGPLINLM